MKLGYEELQELILDIQNKISEEIRIMIYNALVKAGIQIPFPHRTLTISDDLVNKLKK